MLARMFGSVQANGVCKGGFSEGGYLYIMFSFVYMSTTPFVFNHTILVTKAQCIYKFYLNSCPISTVSF